MFHMVSQSMRRSLLAGAGVLALWSTATAFAEENEGDDIVVTGFRAQNQLAVDAKRNAEIIAEFTKSDDIGQQPDYNIADSLRRLPGSRCG